MRVTPLSLGFARVTGPPDAFKGVNGRSPAEQRGQGRAGRKGWGLLSVDGVLYLWLGHADHRGACRRTTMTYCVPLRRYLWWHQLPQPHGVADRGGTRFTKGFAVYDTPAPWGPWTTVFFTEDWDIGPGETASLPAKWMSADGRTVHLVFSGDDHFSVRQGTIVFRTQTNSLSQ